MATSASTIVPTLLLYLIVAAFAATAPPYAPRDYILLDCGSASNTTSQDTRKWQADIFSNSQASQALEQTPSVLQIPYMTARISLSEFTYSFPSLSSGPKLLRLYFYPATYNRTLNKTASFFSVITNQNTLMRNFSAFLAVSSIKPSSPTLIKEYIIHVNDTYQQLNITFVPSTGSYAFINGIEIVSTPDNLYFKGNDVSIKTGTNTLYYLNNGRALETLYRLNVGGAFVPVTGDTGMFRSWIPDDDYVLTSSLPSSITGEVNYSSSTPAYTAPEAVYTSARIMNDNYSLSYNLTWIFTVDSGFNYLLRLHFCEFFLEIREPNQRVFTIFVNNQTVEIEADVIAWADGPQIAVSRDYVALVGGSDGGGSKQDLWLSMKPNTEASQAYDNALLNGLEIFKISRLDGSLDSPNPDLELVSNIPSGQPTISDTKKESKSKVVIAGVAGGVAFVVVVGLMGFLIFRRRRRGTKSDENSKKSYWLSFSDKSRSTKTSVTSGDSLLPADICRHFSFEEIEKATGGFNENVLIGVGGFGNVYKGFVDNGRTEVAIKRLNPSSNQGKHEFFTEIEMLSKLRHLHVVSLIGYCDENGEMILVYDYISHGTLREHLYNSDNPSLTWKRRLQICIGAAKGLDYLHTSAKQSIIHRDVKSTNILLDEKWVAKVSDFGLSKVGPMGVDETHVSTMVKGSFGYVDPEYYRRHQLTEKSDVYSFGVVLFEVLCSRPPIVQSVPKEQVNLANWVRFCYKNDTLSKIIDPTVKNEIAVESWKKFVEIGIRCLKDKGIERPAMRDVVWNLEFALQLQEAAEKRMESNNREDSTSFKLGLDGDARMTEDDNNDVFSGSMDASTSSYSKSKSIGDFSTSTEGFKSQSVFSEIIQPSAR